MHRTQNNNLLKSPAAIKQTIIDHALHLGFSACRVTEPDGLESAAKRLDQYLVAEHHGTMHWMKETQDRRGDPKVLWPGVRSILTLAFNYGPESDPLADLEKHSQGNISVYARNRDYHDIIKGKLKELAGKLASLSGCDVKVFVDTAPVMEKTLAEKAGLGWQGKHTNLVSRESGSWLFLGEIFTAAELPADEPETDHCGSCRACLDVCPTDAFPAPYQLDARRCISYLTIEHKGPIPVEFRKAIGNRIYGCDDCLAVCPWNKFAEMAHEAKLIAREDLTAPTLASLSRLDDSAFRKFFTGSPVKRIGRNRFLRNVLIAMGNSNQNSMADDVMRHLSDADAQVRGAAIWALAHLAPGRLNAFDFSDEIDESVLQELTLATSGTDQTVKDNS